MQDLFVFTPSVFPWRLMPNFVIGRTKYDNYVVQSLAHDPSQVMIDASNMGNRLLCVRSSGDRASNDRRRSLGSSQAAQREEVV